MQIRLEQTEVRAPPKRGTAPTESQTNNVGERLTCWKEGQEEGKVNPEQDVQTDKRSNRVNDYLQ